MFGETKTSKVPVNYTSVMLANIEADRQSSTSGYDYRNQAFVVDGKYVACGHGKPCDCFGTLHAGEPVKSNADVH